MLKFDYKTKWGETYRDCFFVWGNYENNGNIALVIKNEEEGVICTCSVNSNRVNGENEIGIKDYSENEGMVDFLVSMGIIESEPFYRENSGFVTIPYFKLTQKGIDDYLEQKKKAES